MAISVKLLAEIRYDFSTGADTEENHFENDEAFWTWFQQNANLYSLCPSVDTSFTNKSNLPGNCFGNSQRFSLQNDIDYCEGFVKAKNIFIFHGFNVQNNCIIDSTIQSNQDSFADEKGEIPTEYCGVIVPNHFLGEESDIIENYINQSSKLYEYYLNSKDQE